MAKEQEIEITNESPTAEDYAAIKLELEAEKERAAGLVGQATAPLQERITTLEAEVSIKTQDIEALKGQLATIPPDSGLVLEIEALKGQLAEASTNFEGAKVAYAYAVEDFKKLVLQANPLFTADIIGGDTIDAVKTSIEKAGVLVSRVKEGLETQASALSQLSVVPAGAPQRTGPNVEGMSTKEKINLGLEQARKQKEQ